jgi:Tfp pilus assembly protein PilF
MGTDRVEVLKNMLDQDPRNGFVRYGLAMEYVNRGDNEQAVKEFETLLAADADYVAGYFHAGRTLEKLGRTEDARGMYERGIGAARRKGDHHALSELQAALDMVGLT